MNAKIQVAFLTLGCKVNFYETEKMKKQFEAAGHRIVSFNEAADVYIVNTCTVTNIADRKSRKMIHKAKRKNPEALVVATGIKGEDVLTLAKRLVKVNRVYQPDASNKAVYEKNYRVFKRLYRSNARNFSMINGG